MSKPEKCYGINDEYFNHSELEDAITEALDNPDLPVGAVVKVYEGDAVPWKAGDFSDGFPVDSLMERAYDEAGEHAGDWPDCTKEQETDLEQRIKDVVNQWADDHGLQPKFCRVDNVREIQVELTSEDGSYRILEGQS